MAELTGSATAVMIDDAPVPPASGRRVAVTGGASGLGRAVAERLAARYDDVVVIDRHAPDEPEWSCVETDLADTGRSSEQIAEAIGDTALHGLVCAAGIDACGRFEDISFDAWERVVRVNLFGVAAAIRAALPALRIGGGRIVIVGSTLGLKSVSDATAYCASKAAVLAFGRSLALEIAPEVGLTNLVPGGMSTPFFDGRTEQYRPGPDAALNDPDHVAAAILFALDQPPGCELRELTICSSLESSWP